MQAGVTFDEKPTWYTYVPSRRPSFAAGDRSSEITAQLEGVGPVLTDLDVGESPAGIAAGIEFVLEGLHLTKRLNKDAVGARATYRARG